MKDGITYRVISNVFLSLVALTMILPILLIFICSITDENTLIANGYSFFPKQLSFGAYKYILGNSDKIFRAYGISIITTVVGTSLGLLITAMMGFGLSLKELPGKRIITVFIVITMLFNGGLVPTYILWSSIGISDTIWAYVFPFLLTNAFNIILVRTSFSRSIPPDIYESAKIDGAGYWRIFWKMTLPLGKPILVTIGLFSFLAYWNDWQNGLYFINDVNMLSIQAMLNKMIQNIQAVVSNSSYTSANAHVSSIPMVSIRMAIAFVAILPILVMYPFLQKYFESGIMLGAVKG